MHIKKENLESSSVYKEQLNKLLTSEDRCRQIVGAYIQDAIFNHDGFIKDDVLEYISSANFGGKENVNIVIFFLSKPAYVDIRWLELIVKTVNSKNKDDIINFLNEIQGAYSSGIPVETVEKCLDNAEDPHAMAVALENNTSDGAYAKMLESLSAVTNVIEKIEFDRHSQSQEYGYIEDVINDLKEQIKEKDSLLEKKSSEIEELKDRLNSKSDVDTDNLSKLKEDKEFYEKKYREIRTELNDAKNENGRLEIKIMQLEKKISDGLPEQQPTVVKVDNEELLNKVNTLIEQTAKFEQLTEDISAIKESTYGIKYEFNNINEGLKTLDDSITNIISNELNKVSQDIKNDIEKKIEDIIVGTDNTDSIVSVQPPNNETVSEPVIKVSDEISESEKEYVGYAEPEYPFDEVNSESSVNDVSDNGTDSAEPESASEIEIDIPDIYEEQKLISDVRVTDSSSELQSGVTVSEINTVTEDKKDFFTSLKTQFVIRKQVKAFSKIKDVSKKKQLILEKAMENHIDKEIIRTIKEIFDSKVVSLNYVYKLVLNKETSLEDVIFLKEYCTAS